MKESGPNSQWFTKLDAMNNNLVSIALVTRPPHPHTPVTSAVKSREIRSCNRLISGRVLCVRN